MRSDCRRRNSSGYRSRSRIRIRSRSRSRSRSSNRSGSNRSCSRSSNRGSSWLTWRQGLDALQMQRCLFSLKVFLGENALGVVVPQLQKQSTNRSIVHCAVQMLARGGRKLSSNHRDRTYMMCIFVLFCFSVVLRAVSLSSPREPLILLIGNLLIVKVTVGSVRFEILELACRNDLPAQLQAREKAHIKVVGMIAVDRHRCEPWR